MTEKEKQRKALEEAMLAFQTKGGEIKKCKPKGKQRFEKNKPELTNEVEIQVEQLPVVLRHKFFPEEQ